MKLLVAISTRYYQTPDNRIWTTTSYDTSMWQEHQRVFTTINVLARVLPVLDIPEGAKRADGDNINYYGLPEWNSMRYPFLRQHISKIALSAVEHSDAALLHSPGIEADSAFKWASKKGLPIALECRGEQGMNVVYWQGRGTPFPQLLAQYHERQFNRHLAKSWGCAYVAEQLKRQFPPQNAQIQAEVISDIRIPDNFFTGSKEFNGNSKQIKFVNVGRLEAQKDLPTLLKACAALNTTGVRQQWQLHLVGSGPLENQLKQLALDLDIVDQVVFHGFVKWGSDLFGLLDEMDLFVLSSVSEGMPRALLEAMARGLPCISTMVSGANEVLPANALVPIGDSETLAQRLHEVIHSPAILTDLSETCWRSVQAFRKDALQEKKVQFLQGFRQEAEITSGSL